MTTSIAGQATHDGGAEHRAAVLSGKTAGSNHCYGRSGHCSSQKGVLRYEHSNQRGRTKMGSSDGGAFQEGPFVGRTFARFRVLLLRSRQLGELAKGGLEALYLHVFSIVPQGQSKVSTGLTAGQAPTGVVA